MTAILADRLVARDDDPAVLDAIAAAGCALAIHDRALPPALAAAVGGLDLDGVDDIDDAVPLDAAALHVAVRLGAAGYPAAAAVLLAVEIGGLADRFAAIAGAGRARLRLEVVETDACRRVHADRVTLRLLCTLSGRGTQWIAADDPDAVDELPAGAVAIFKGRRLLDPPPLLHRSPPILATGERRLLLVLDPA